jgi:hypothetical protein
VDRETNTAEQSTSPDPSMSIELVVKDKADDVVAHAESEGSRLGTLTWQWRAVATGFVSLNSLARKASRSAGANWSAAPWPEAFSRDKMMPDR